MGFLVVLFIYGHFIEPNGIKIREISIQSDFFHHPLEDKTIVHLSDLHLSGFGKNASAHSEVSDLVNAVARAVTSPSTVLIKGSRFARMERVSDALQCMEESKC